MIAAGRIRQSPRSQTFVNLRGGPGEAVGGHAVCVQATRCPERALGVEAPFDRAAPESQALMRVELRAGYATDSRERPAQDRPR